MTQSAVVMPKWIGDYVMALSVVEEKRRITDGPISLITAPYLVELARTLTTMEVIPYKTDDGLQQVKERGFSDLYILPHSISTALWGFSTGIRKRYGYKKEGRSPLLTHRLKRDNLKRTRHITAEYSKLLNTPLPAVSSLCGTTLPVKPSGAIIICPGAKYGPAKQWPHFSYLLEAIPDEKFIILGGADEAAYADILIKENPSRDISNLCGDGSLVDAARHLAAAKAVISNDSGLMHLAAYVGAPLIGIFGSSTPVWTTPIGNSSRVIWHNEPCSPCFKRECPFGHYKCLDKISVEEVVSHLKELL